MKNGLAAVVLSCLAVISSSTAAQAQLAYHIDKEVLTVGEAVMMDTSPASNYETPSVAAPNVTTVFTKFLRPGFHWVNLKLGSLNQWLEFTVIADRDCEKFNLPARC